jgi:hypothetical protein
MEKRDHLINMKAVLFSLEEDRCSIIEELDALSLKERTKYLTKYLIKHLHTHFNLHVSTEVRLNGFRRQTKKDIPAGRYRGGVIDLRAKSMISFKSSIDIEIDSTSKIHSVRKLVHSKLELNNQVLWVRHGSMKQNKKRTAEIDSMLMEHDIPVLVYKMTPAKRTKRPKRVKIDFPLIERFS